MAEYELDLIKQKCNYFKVFGIKGVFDIYLCSSEVFSVFRLNHFLISPAVAEVFMSPPKKSDNISQKLA